MIAITNHSRKQISVPRFLALASIFLAPLWVGTPYVLAGEPPTEPQATANEESAESYKNVLRWATASEVDNFGYDVYRSQHEEGPFELATAEPMLGAGTTDETSQYEFVDNNIDPYITYWYYIESISKAGVRERFTPVFEKEAQLVRESSDSEAGDGDPGQE